MRNPKQDARVSELEGLIHARRETGATFTELARELGVSPSQVSSLYRVAARKLAAQRLRRAGRRRIDFVGRR